MASAATLASLRRVCSDSAESAPDAYPSLLAVCTAALLHVDESYVSAGEMAKAHRRLAPALAALGDEGAGVSARLEACRDAFEALDEEDPRRAELLRAPPQQRAVDRFAGGNHPVLAYTSLPPLPPANATAQALRRRRAKRARAERDARGEGPDAVRARRRRSALLSVAGAALATLLLAALHWLTRKR